MDTISNAKNPTMEAGDGMLHILLCDDDAIFTEALKRLIEAQPEFNRRYMQIECVHDPNALKKAAVQKADMIFLDIDMGDVNGIALPQPYPHAECSVRRRGYEHRARRVGLRRNRGTDADLSSCGTGSAAEKPHEPAHAGRKTGGGGIFAHPQQLLGQYELYCCPANKRRYVDYRSGASRQPARV